VPVTFFAALRQTASVQTTVDLRQMAQPKRSPGRASQSAALPFAFAVSNLPEVMEPVAGHCPCPA
jgi:hypothetical protein